MEYKYPSLNHLGKRFIFLYSLKIHTLTFIAFITQKQEQTFLFLEFKTLSFIYYNLYLKLLIFIIGRYPNPIKKGFFLGTKKSTIHCVLSQLRRRGY